MYTIYLYSLKLTTLVIVEIHIRFYLFFYNFGKFAPIKV
jgi:hypothetical protein